MCRLALKKFTVAFLADLGEEKELKTQYLFLIFSNNLHKTVHINTLPSSQRAEDVEPDPNPNPNLSASLSSI